MAVLTREQFLNKYAGFASRKMGEERQAWLANHPTAAAEWAQTRSAERWLETNVGADWKSRGDAGYYWSQAAKAVTAPAQAAAPATAPAAAVPAQSGTASPPAASPQDNDAEAYVRAQLDAWGLGAAGAAAWERYKATGSTALVFNELRSGADWSQGAYKTRFAGMAALQAKGRAITEDQYIGLERQYAEQMRTFGLPATFYDSPEDFAKLIEREVSPREFERRLTMEQRAALTDPRGIAFRDKMVELGYAGDPTGAATAYWIDPDRTEEVLRTQFQATTAAVAAKQAGFGDLNRSEAEYVGQWGVSEEQAADTFSNLAGMTELTQQLPGQADAVSRQDLLAAGFGSDADAKKKVEKTARTRKAQFEAGGGYATGRDGVTGLGSATS